MKNTERTEARRLRTEDRLSLKTIAERLGVAKSSVSLWVRDLPLSQQRMKELNLVGGTRGGLVRSTKARDIRRQYQQDGRNMAEKLQNETLFVAGCMMHWSEGEKSKNRVSISNTDLDFLRLWLSFALRFFDVCRQDMTLAIHCHTNNGLTKEQIENYWLEQLCLPRSCLRATSVLIKEGSFKKNKHPYGVARIDIGSTRVVQSIWGAIKFIANIDGDKWLQ